METLKNYIFEFSHGYLKYLSLIDLYNFGLTSRYHQIVACQEFRRSCHDYEISISSVRDDILNAIQFDCYLRGFFLVLGFLRVFGNEIRTLIICNHDNLPKKMSRVMEYIYLYCGSLHEISFCCYKTVIQFEMKPFESVKVVTYFDSDFDHDLNTVFPNMCSLSLTGQNTFRNLNQLIVHYQFLENLFISPKNTYFVARLPEFRRLNPNVMVVFVD